MYLRSYRSEDCRETAQLFYDTVHEVNSADYTEEEVSAWADGNIDLEAWNSSLMAHYTIVALDNDTIVGFGDITEDGYLDRLYIHKDYQRRGIATLICSKLEAKVSGTITTHASITARSFFEKRGYHAVQKQQVTRNGVLLTNYVMEKENS